MGATPAAAEPVTGDRTGATTGGNRGHNFGRLWAASAGSNLGDGIGVTAAPLLAAGLTRDPMLVAGLVVAQRLPWLIFTLVSGALVDRLDRRLVLGGANLCRAVLIGVLGLAVLAGCASLPLLYGVFFLLGAAETLSDNAALAILPAIVPADQLERANGRIFAAQTVANEFAGPPLGGALFTLFVAAPFLANAGSYAVAAALVLTLRGRFRPLADEGATAPLGAAIVEGLRWFWGHRLLRTLGGMAGAVNFFSAATLGPFVLVAQERLGLGEVGFGAVLAAGATGGVAGGWVAYRVAACLGPGATIFATNLLPGLAYLVIAWTTSPILVGAMFAVMSFAAMIGNVVLISLRQSTIPDRLLGRVTSAYRLLALGALPAGARCGGFLARSFDLTAPYWAGGVALIAMAFALLPLINDRAIARAQAAGTST